MNFKLRSPWLPAGDQQQAIEKLTTGINNKLPYQVLLGVTGSGKSLTFDEPILIFNQVGDDLKPQLLPIGELIDGLFDKYGSRKEGNSEILLAKRVTGSFRVISLNPKTLKQEIQSVKSFIRHRSPGQIFLVKTACGRKIKVTGDHNFWVLRGGKLWLVKTSEIERGDYLPLPVKLSFNVPPDKFNGLWLNEWLRRNIYFSFDDLPGNRLNKKEKIQKVLGWAKFWAASKKGERIHLRYLPMIAHNLKSLKFLTVGRRIGKKVSLYQKISKELLELTGFYVAEGHAEKNYLTISVHEKSLQKILTDDLDKLKIDYHERNLAPGDFQISNSIWSEIFSSWCGNRAVSKSLPPWFLELGNDQLSLMLSAYFSGDGNVTKNEIAAVTASRKLASDLSYALLRFGIKVRIREKLKRATNSNMKKRRYLEIVISGQNELRIFEGKIGFILKRKQKKLREIIKKKANTNVDLIPINGDSLLNLRKSLELKQKDFAAMAGCERSYISMLENGKRFPSRSLLKRLLMVVKPKIRNMGNLQELEMLESLTEVFWTKVKEIKIIKPVSKFVYDVAVEKNETFLAGMGGIFVHNTFTIAQVIQKTQKPALVIAPNKALAVQLYQEYKEFFPQNAVGFFVSYYDYYQPESYLPQTDTYIAKETDINEEIDKLRLQATSLLFSRPDVIIVASVSCIYNIGSPFEYGRNVVELRVGQKAETEALLYQLVSLHYTRSRLSLERGTFRVRGATVEILPAYVDEILRITIDRGKIAGLQIRPLIGGRPNAVASYLIYPAKHFLTDPGVIKEATRQIKEDLKVRLAQLKKDGKLLEIQRLEQRTNYDLEMIAETGYVNGIENYSRYFDGRLPGEAPWTLIDYFRHVYQDDFLTVIDESHLTVPQIRGMYKGDLSRKKTLVDFGFRLPSCLDNRPLKFAEFLPKVSQVIYASATPDEWEIKKARGQVAEQLIRPTGLVDPEIIIRPAAEQINDLVKEIVKRKRVGQRTLVTTLTKKTAEELARWLADSKNTGEEILVHFLHADVATLERSDILADLRAGKYDVVVGVNLLREGLDLPEVSLVAILDADQQGFLRSRTSLIQTMGRAARHISGQVILYAKETSSAMSQAIREVERRRRVQLAYNREHGIIPRSIEKPIRDRIVKKSAPLPKVDLEALTPGEKKKMIPQLRRDMRQAAAMLDFEKAAQIRDVILKISSQ